MSAVLLAVPASKVNAGWIALLVVIALVIAAAFLFRSMTHHLRKVPPRFDPPPDERPVSRPEDDATV
jgi:hypothetical protein